MSPSRKCVSGFIETGLAILAMALISACTATTSQNGGPTYAELDTMSESAIATLLATNPTAEKILEESVGYAVLNMTVTKIPVIGTGVGYGVVFDKLSDTHSYIRVSRFEVGSGMGANKYKVIIVFSDHSLVQKIAKTSWLYDVGAQASAGDKSAEGNADTSAKGYQAFRLTDSGALASLTVRVARAKPYL